MLHNNDLFAIAQFLPGTLNVRLAGKVFRQATEPKRTIYKDIDDLNWVLNENRYDARSVVEIAKEAIRRENVMLLQQFDIDVINHMLLIPAITESGIKGHVHTLEHLLSIQGINQKVAKEGCQYAAVKAAGCGHLQFLQALHAKGITMSFAVLREAVQFQHVECVKWLIQKQQGWNIMFSGSLTEIAASTGDLNMMKMLVDNGCPWGRCTTSLAASKGHLDVIEWAYRNGCEWDPETLKSATQEGHTHIIEWATKNGYENYG